MYNVVYRFESTWSENACRGLLAVRVCRRNLRSSFRIIYTLQLLNYSLQSFLVMEILKIRLSSLNTPRLHARLIELLPTQLPALPCLS